MANSNPETVSTDYDTSDALYFEPLTLEDLVNVYERERCVGAIVQFGGQTPLNLAQALKAAGLAILGTDPDDIDLAEDRDRFKRLADAIGILQPPSGIAHTAQDALAIADRLGYPVLVRPSFVLGGRGMVIVHRREDLDALARQAVSIAEGKPILIDRFLQNAVELDVDAVSDGRDTVIGAVLEHVEPAGVHSGDAACLTPPLSLDPPTLDRIRAHARAFARALHVRGLMNLQLAVKGHDVYVIEVNPRASRTVPFVSKAIGLSLAAVAARVMAGQTLAQAGLLAERPPLCHAAKEAVFPFARFPGAEIVLSPEMKSTGEVMGLAPTPGLAYLKSQLAAGTRLPLPEPGRPAPVVLLSLCDADKPAGVAAAKRLAALGYALCATRGTAIMSSLPHGYKPVSGRYHPERNGALIAFEAGTSTAYALDAAQARGTLFIPPGVPVYQGMIVGLSNKKEDLDINICREKQLTNMRTHASDGAIQLTPYTQYSLEQCIDFLLDDELLEVTPKSLRLRKRQLDPIKRKRENRAYAN